MGKTLEASSALQELLESAQVTEAELLSANEEIKKLQVENKSMRELLEKCEPFMDIITEKIPNSITVEIKDNHIIRGLQVFARQIYGKRVEEQPKLLDQIVERAVRFAVVNPMRKQAFIKTEINNAK